MDIPDRALICVRVILDFMNIGYSILVDALKAYEQALAAALLHEV